MPVEVSPTLLKELDLRTDRLTTLELLSEDRYGTDLCKTNKDVHATLHHFLSTSDNIVHLKTLKAMVLVEHIDIYHRGRRHAPLQCDEPTSATGVWRCRSLRTLHIEIHGHKELLSEPLHSRIVFGYISRVCPLLEELRMTVPGSCDPNTAAPSYYPTLCFGLEGGMCLLGRLRQLQRLEVRRGPSTLMPKFTRVDLDWMVPAGQSDKSKRWRQHKVKQWQKDRIKERDVGKHQSQQQEHQHQSWVASEGADISTNAALLGRLKNLGLLEDVEEMVKNMDMDSCRPFPALEGLTFEHFSFQWPEKVLDEMFPDNRTTIFGFKLGFK
ncbi:hypothetical protein BGW39_006264 [Mortierella sp. 14UC]|nr:hypothetical protein BGW39_006264 [Mortierella sp. 14UC]